MADSRHFGGAPHPFGLRSRALYPLNHPAGLKHLMANSDRHCLKCGANLDLVGFVHNCRPRMANAPPDMANEAEPVANSTYRYRDVEKRRTYMRDYMRRRRSA